MIANQEQVAEAIGAVVAPALADRLEVLVDDAACPLPKHRELLFLH